MKRLVTFLLLAVFILGVTAQIVSAQNYYFGVQRMAVSLYINADGTATIDYTIDFANTAKGAAIDYVDIGLPNDAYSMSSIKAEVNGFPITDIQKSEFVNPGVALGLGSNAIRAGKTGRVHVRIGVVKNIIYVADNKETENYASVQFSPTWFGSEYVTGSTDYTFTLFLPPNINPEEPRYYIPKNWPGVNEPTPGADATSGLKFYTWKATGNASTQYIFGSSFPARLVPAASVQSKPLIQIHINEEDLCCLGIGGLFASIFGLGFYEAIWGAKKRKLKYLPPSIAIEGHGIKRGLTAVEAAIILEEPMDRILTMMLFSSVKKGAATVANKNPLNLVVHEPLPASLQAYEVDFLKAFKQVGNAERKAELKATMVALVKSTAEKMRGFSRKETVAYYQDIMKKAWEQVEAAQTPEMKMQAYDDNMDWTMLDKKFEDRTRNVFNTGPVFVPRWWGHYDPSFAGANLPSAPSTGGGGFTFTLPNLPGSDFASSIVNGVQNFASNAVGDVTAFTGGITNSTNPVPVSTSSRSGGSSGGHSCACACACAGCACACAGGGR